MAKKKEYRVFATSVHMEKKEGESRYHLVIEDWAGQRIMSKEYHMSMEDAMQEMEEVGRMLEGETNTVLFDPDLWGETYPAYGSLAYRNFQDNGGEEG